MRRHLQAILLVSVANFVCGQECTIPGKIEDLLHKNYMSYFLVFPTQVFVLEQRLHSVMMGTRRLVWNFAKKLLDASTTPMTLLILPV